MSSILNSISQGDLQVQPVPRDKPIKEDSIADLLQSSEIEFETQPCNKESSKLPIFEEFEIIQTDVEPKPSLDDLFQNSDISLPANLPIIDKLDDVNTGFGENHDLHYHIQCHKLTKPLYKENYLSEFVTEEDKAAARHALGLYNKGDIVAMSLLTAEDEFPSLSEITEATIKQLRKGDKFFTPITTFKAVIDDSGQTLQNHVDIFNQVIVQHAEQISYILNPTQSQDIVSLGDVQKFVAGFDNGDSLHSIIQDMKESTVYFDNIGLIK